MHYALQKLNWPPSALKEWAESAPELKAFCYASTELKIEAEQKEAEKMRGKA